MVRRTRHAAYEIRYHFVWVPKYRRKVLAGGIPERLTALLDEKTQEMGGEIIAGPFTMESCGRYCVFKDPASAVAALFEPVSP